MRSKGRITFAPGRPGLGAGSVAQPAETNASNVTGFLNMLWAARENGIQRFVFAQQFGLRGCRRAAAG